MDVQEKDTRTPFFIEAQKGHASVAKLLIEARCNVDLKDGSTPLYYAAS
jgi:hypothetical protein